jgi:hypothetical protein
VNLTDNDGCKDEKENEKDHIVGMLVLGTGGV